MRHVLKNHSEVCHVWASRQQSDGRASRIFFEHDTIYSYGGHFPIAKFQKMPNGETVVLFNTDDYSRSTSGHKHEVRCAIPDKYAVFEMTSRCWNSYKDGKQQLIQQVERAFDSASRARENAKMHVASANRCIRKLAEWAELHKKQANFKLKQKHHDIIKRAEVMHDRAEVRTAERTEVRTAERIERERLAKIALEEFEAKYGCIAHYYHKNGELPDYTMLRGLNINRFSLPAYCKISDDGKEVVTSKSARVPVSHAKRIIQRVLQCRKDSTDFLADPNRPIRVGLYELQSISKDGDVKIGCHKIEWGEIEYIAGQLGIVTS